MDDKFSLPPMDLPTTKGNDRQRSGEGKEMSKMENEERGVKRMEETQKTKS